MKPLFKFDFHVKLSIVYDDEDASMLRDMLLREFIEIQRCYLADFYNSSVDLLPQIHNCLILLMS